MRGNPFDRAAQFLPPAGNGVQRRRIEQFLGKDHPQHHQHQPDVAVGPHRHMFIAARGFGVARINNHDPAFCRNRVQPGQRARLADQRHVRCHRIAANDDEKVAILKIGEAEAVGVAIGQLHRQIFGARVGVERVELAGAAKRAQETVHIGCVQGAKGGGVADVGGNAFATMAFNHARQPPGNVVQRLVPADRFEFAGTTLAAQRMEHTVGIMHHIDHSGALDANMAPRHRMLVIRADAHDAPAAYLNAQSAQGFAKPAKTDVPPILARRHPHFQGHWRSSAGAGPSAWVAPLSAAQCGDCRRSGQIFRGLKRERAG